MIPGWLATEASPGLVATVRLSRLKARSRSSWARTKARIDAGLLATGLVVAVLSGDLAVRLAAGQGSPLAEALAQMARGSLGAGGSAAVALVVAGLVFAPATGAATHAQFSDLDLAGIRPPRLHRYFDGVWNSVVSPVGASPLLILTSLASLVTSSGPGRLVAVALAWVTWLTLLTLLAASGWTIDYLRRRWTPRLRWYAVAGAAAGTGVAVLLDPNRGRTGFGLADRYAAIVSAAARGEPGPALLGIGVLLAGGVGLGLAGMALCRAALALPAPVQRQDQTVRAVSVPQRPLLALGAVIGTSLWRSREVRRPILMMVLAAMPLLIGGIRYTGGQGSSVLASVLLVVPLSLALGWGVNVLGALGGAVTLLLAQPGAWRPLLRAMAGIQLVVTLLLGTALLVIGAGFSDSWQILPSFVVGLVVASVIATASSLRYSLRRPHRTRLTGRGEPLVPPVVGLEYVVRLMVTAGLAGVAVATVGTLAPGWFLGVALAATVGYGWWRWRSLARIWSDPYHRARVAALVGAV